MLPGYPYDNATCELSQNLSVVAPKKNREIKFSFAFIVARGFRRRQPVPPGLQVENRSSFPAINFPPAGTY
jgi:hypothetical protein